MIHRIHHLQLSKIVSKGKIIQQSSDCVETKREAKRETVIFQFKDPCLEKLTEANNIPQEVPKSLKALDEMPYRVVSYRASRQ